MQSTLVTPHPQPWVCLTDSLWVPFLPQGAATPGPVAWPCRHALGLRAPSPQPPGLTTLSGPYDLLQGQAFLALETAWIPVQEGRGSTLNPAGDTQGVTGHPPDPTLTQAPARCPPPPLSERLLVSLFWGSRVLLLSQPHRSGAVPSQPLCPYSQVGGALRLDSRAAVNPPPPRGELSRESQSPSPTGMRSHCGQSLCNAGAGQRCP